MSPSSDSISSTSLPFGADIHIHTLRGRSRSVPRSVHHEYQPAIDHQGPQTYAAFIANAQASDAVSRLSNAQIPPTSMKSIPRSHKKVLKQHSVLLWVVIVILLISLIALTAAIVLGAVKAHQHAQNGVKCAAIIVGVFAFSGLVGSAAVIWLILTGRKERARLERSWAEQERVKEAASIWERRTESQLRKIIRDRERSLSRSRSRGRDRNRPSFKDMTATPTSSTRIPGHNAQPVARKARTPWSSHIDSSSGLDGDPDDAIEQKDDEKPDEKDSSYTNNGDEHQNDGGHEKDVKVQATQKRRDSASTSFRDLDPSGSDNDDNNNKSETASRSNIDILEREILSKLSLPHKPSPAHSDSSQTAPVPLKKSSTYINSSPTEIYPTASAPHNPPRAPAIEQVPFDPGIVRSHHPGIGNLQGIDTTPRDIPGWRNGGLGSAQSDENFQAMLDLADDVGSDDEKDRQIRRQKGKEKVEEWASTVDPEADGGGREEKVMKLKEALERGLQRVANRKKERRQAVLGAKAEARGDGSERRR